MKTQKIEFQVNGQHLEREGGLFEYASNTVDYITAEFTFGEGWDDLDVVRAVFAGGGKVIAVLIEDNKCIIPHEVLRAVGPVKVNLAGSVFEDEKLTDRITTFPVTALIVTKAAIVDDSATPTPTEFEQFVAEVKADADRAEEAVSDAGWMDFYIEDGCLYYEHSLSSEITFSIEDGYLYVDC